MKLASKLILTMVAVFFAGYASADCAKRVSQTQAAIENLLHQNGSSALNGTADIELTVLLLDLCRDSMPEVGSTNVRTEDAQVTTTRGLNPKPDMVEVDDDDKTATFLGLEVSPKGSGAKFKRTGKKK